MKIASQTSIVGKITKILKPIIKFLFKDIKEDEEAQEEISMNMVANIMGLGNAATPLGLKAMNTLQKRNKEKDKLSDSMIMLIVINTASLQIIPTTAIAIRTSLGSKNPTSIIVPVWIATLAAVTSVITITKILIKKWR